MGNLWVNQEYFFYPKDFTIKMPSELFHPIFKKSHLSKGIYYKLDLLRMTRFSYRFIRFFFSLSMEFITLFHHITI